MKLKIEVTGVTGVLRHQLTWSQRIRRQAVIVNHEVQRRIARLAEASEDLTRFDQNRISSIN